MRRREGTEKQAEAGKQIEAEKQTETEKQIEMIKQTEITEQIQTAGGIHVTMPAKVFFSKDPSVYIVKNDFYITITGAIPAQKEPAERTCAAKGEEYPAIYIKGFEQLFDDGISRHDQMDAFFKMFHVNGNKDWEIGYGKFRDTEEECVVITTASLSLKPDFSVGFQLSDKCAFTKILEDTSPIALDVYVDDFDSFFPDLDSRIRFTLSLERGYAVCIERFGAYMPSDPDTAVTAVHKGDSCSVSWRIEQDEKASAFLYDENGTIVANLPPYTAKIDKDRKFMLLAYNDYCSVQQFLTVYRTLWSRTGENTEGFPKTDKEGRFKIYQNYGGSYFLYVHPRLYVSEDCTTWEVYAENTTAVSGYTFYSSAFSENKFCVCYLDAGKITYCEMNREDKKWSEYVMDRSGLTGAYALLSDPKKTRLVLAAKDGLAVYELRGGTLLNGEFIEAPQDTELLSADVLADGRKSYVAAVCGNGRVYFYDLDDDFRNNIFECPRLKDDNIWLVKSNAVYILLNGYVFEVNDREKFMDMHYFPEFMKETRPAVGAFDREVIRGIFQNGERTESWNYHF